MTFGLSTNGWWVFTPLTHTLFVIKAVYTTSKLLIQTCTHARLAHTHTHACVHTHTHAHTCTHTHTHTHTHK